MASATATSSTARSAVTLGRAIMLFRQGSRPQAQGVGGRTFRVGGASFFQVEFSWDQEYVAAERFAPVRARAQAHDGRRHWERIWRPLFMYGWMLKPQSPTAGAHPGIRLSRTGMGVGHHGSQPPRLRGHRLAGHRRLRGHPQEPVPKVHRIEVDDAGSLVSVAIPTADPTSMAVIGHGAADRRAASRRRIDDATSCTVVEVEVAHAPRPSFAS